MKFEKKKVPDLLTGKDKIVYEADKTSAPGGFVVAADGRGVTLSGDGLALGGKEDLDTFAKTIGLAWRDHRAIRQSTFDALASKGGPA